jgi:hypothetical protein
MNVSSNQWSGKRVTLFGYVINLIESDAVKPTEIMVVSAHREHPALPPQLEGVRVMNLEDMSIKDYHKD